MNIIQKYETLKVKTKYFSYSMVAHCSHSKFTINKKKTLNKKELKYIFY